MENINPFYSPSYTSNYMQWVPSPITQADQRLEEAAEDLFQHAYSTKDFSMLKTFFYLQYNGLQKETQCKLAVLMNFLRKDYFNVFFILTNNLYSEKNFEVLQNIWYESLYEQKAVEIGKSELNYVEKYRARRKYPHPPTIGPNTGRKNQLSVKSTSILKKYFAKSQYYTMKELGVIAIAAELELNQVKHWFKNQRQRDKKKAIKEKETQELHETSQTTNVVVQNPYAGIAPLQELSQNHYYHYLQNVFKF